MKGKIVVLTGGTSGIGYAAANALAGQGASMILLARDRERGQATIQALPEAPSQTHRLYVADLSSIADTKRAAAEIAADVPSINVLINNAGGWFGKRELTSEGLERTFAVNHMAYFVMTLGLIEPLRNATRARVINTSSFVHRRQLYDADNLQMERGYSLNGAYARSKLYNELFTAELARRWQVFGITANSFSPGFVNTKFGAGQGGWMEPYYRFIRRFGKTPTQGAETMLYLATSPDVADITGEYFEGSRIAKPGKAARDPKAALDLWNRSLALAGMTGAEGAIF